MDKKIWTPDSLIDYYMNETGKWVIYPWERRETIETIWKEGHKSKMKDSDIRDLLNSLGYTDEEIERWKNGK